MGSCAHQGMRDATGRVIVFGWVRGAGWYSDGGRGWSGCMTPPRVVIRFDGGHLHLSGADPEGVFAAAREPSPGGDYRIPFALREEEHVLRLHLFLDGCVVELFLNDRACITRAIYSPDQDLGVAAFAEGGSVELSLFDALGAQSRLVASTRIRTGHQRGPARPG